VPVYLKKVGGKDPKGKRKKIEHPGPPDPQEGVRKSRKKKGKERFTAGTSRTPERESGQRRKVSGEKKKKGLRSKRPA